MINFNKYISESNNENEEIIDILDDVYRRYAEEDLEDNIKFINSDTFEIKASRNMLTSPNVLKDAIKRELSKNGYNCDISVEYSTGSRTYDFYVELA